MRVRIALAAAAAVAAFASPVQAEDTGIVINQGVQEVVPGVYAYDSPGEQGGGGSTGVTSAAPRAAPGTSGDNGSLEIHGDRSRYVIGSIYENFNGSPAQQLQPLSELGQLNFDWQMAIAGSGQTHAAPVVRVHVMDNGIRSELIWEWVYNGGTAGVAPPTGWQTTVDDSLFYLNVRDHDGAAFLAQNSSVSGLSLTDGDQGVLLLNGGQVNNAIGDWQSLFSSSAYITGFSFGAGSGFGSDFVGFIDNVRLSSTDSDDRTILNFEVATTAVPEPATWAMMIGGFGMIGGAMRRRQPTFAPA